VNFSSPEPLPNADFMRVLREAWGTPLGLPASEWMLEVGTYLMQSETELVLKSRRVIPTRLLQDGFVFRFPGWSEAAQNLCRQWRNSHSIQQA
jgi:NAD dependent epimerase/dehydratase family enzyme